MGGHEAVRDEVLEDVELAARVKAEGGRLIFLPGASWAETRMYRTFREMWSGWTKNLYLLYGRKLGRVAQSLAEITTLDLALPASFFWLCGVAAMGRGSASDAMAAALCFFLIVFRHWNYAGILSRLGFDPGLASRQSPGAALFGLLLLNSARAHCWTGSVQWKGRVYPAKGLARGRG